MEKVREALEDLKPGQAKVVEFPRVLQGSEPAEAENKKPSEEPSTPQTAVAKMCTLLILLASPRGLVKYHCIVDNQELTWQGWGLLPV